MEGCSTAAHGPATQPTGSAGLQGLYAAQPTSRTGAQAPEVSALRLHDSTPGVILAYQAQPPVYICASGTRVQVDATSPAGRSMGLPLTCG